MPGQNALIPALNAGGIDPEALGRVDLAKMRVAGEHPVANWLPRPLGPMTLFPGSETLSAVTGNAETRMLRFWRDDGDSYMLMLQAGTMHVISDGAAVTIPSVSTAVATGSWTDESSGSATASGGATLTLNATATARARLRQSITVAGGDLGVEHVLQVVVTRGPVYVRIGSTAGGADLMASGTDAELDDGTHFLAFTPAASPVYVDVWSSNPVTRTAQVTIAASGTLSLPTPWATLAQIDALRTWQSLDVIFAGDGTVQPQRIENRGSARSWGIAAYKTANGPFVTGSSQTTMTPAALVGNTTITASDDTFVAGHVGDVLELTHIGKRVEATLDGADQASDYVTITGVGNARRFLRSATQSSLSGTLVLEQSTDPVEPVVWTVVATYVDAAATVASGVYDDDLDNVTAHYRWRMSAYTSGSVDVELFFGSDVQVGRARITARNSATEAAVEVLETFGNTEATRTWRISDWSATRSWPRTPVIHDGRLHWFRGDTDFASVVDDYVNFDDSVIGDAGPFTRSVGSGGEAGVRWAISADRLLAGTSRSEAVIAASELDGALTPTQYTVRRPARRGSADIRAVEHDDGIVFVQRSERRLYEIRRPVGSSQYETVDLSRLNPAAYRAGIIRVAVQQQPILRVYALIAGGTLSVLTYDRSEEVAAITTRAIAGGVIEDIETLPGDEQDDVYLIVNRDGTRYLERFAPEADQMAVATCALLDGHKVLTGSISSISGATRFASQTVQVWADGARRADVTLDASGNGSLGATYSRVVYGKAYTAKWLSTKLEYASGRGTALSQLQQVRGVGMLLHNSCMDGIVVGPSEAKATALPLMVNGAERTANQFFDHHEFETNEIDADWQADSRFYIGATSAEGPVTVQALIADVLTRDGSDSKG